MRLEEIAATDDLEVVQEEANIAIAQVERLTRVVDDLLARTRAVGRAPADRLARLGHRRAAARVAAGLRAGPAQRAGARRAGPLRPGRPRSPSRRCSPRCSRTRSPTAAARSTSTPAGRGPSVVVEVSDQGDGVPADDRPAHLRALGHHRRRPGSAWPWRATSPSPTAAGSSSSRPSRRSSRCSSRSPTRSEATEGEARDHRPGCRGLSSRGAPAARCPRGARPWRRRTAGRPRSGTGCRGRGRHRWRDVVSEGRAQVQDVVGQAEAGQRDDHARHVDKHEQAARGPRPPVGGAGRSSPVAKPGDQVARRQR